MKCLILFLLLAFPVMGHGAVKGINSTGWIWWGDGSLGCARCLPHLTSVSFFHWVKNTNVAGVGGQNNVHLAFFTEGGAGANVASDWNVTNSNEQCSVSGTVVNLGTTATGTWHAVGCVWDGTTLYGYLDGVQIGTASVSSSGAGTAGLMTGYSYAPSPSNFSNDTLAEMACWVNLALTANEMKALAKGTTPTTLRKPTVYSTMWGTGASTGTEADLSGCFQNTACGGNNPGFVAYGVYNIAGVNQNFTGFNVVSHSPVRPFSTAEEGSW